MNRLLLAVAAVLPLVGCTTPVPTQPADPKVVAEIVGDCVGSGLFVQVNGEATGVATAIPVVGLAIGILGQLVDLGITQVCANPAMYAGDLAAFRSLLALMQQKNVAMRRGVMR